MAQQAVVRALCGFVFAAGALSAQTIWTPTKFWTQDAEYAGSKACQACHPKIYQTQDSSSHARSLRPTVEVSEFLSGIPFRFDDRTAQAELTLTRDEEGQVVLAANKEGREDRIVLEWVFGAGGKGITPVGRTAEGSFVEGRLSWYRHSGTYDLTPGARSRVPRTLGESLGQVLTHNEREKCFGCHTSASTEARPIPERHEMGIRCERCHGPGAEHIRAMNGPSPKDRRIFQPGNLDAFQMAQMCGVCHGRPPGDTDFEAIRTIQHKPLTARFPSQRLVLSRCFNESLDGLRCTVCHDPHTNNPEMAQHFDKACLSCHSNHSEERASVCAVGTAGCASCHMPKKQVMPHSRFADHWIRVVREEPDTPAPRGDGL